MASESSCVSSSYSCVRTATTLLHELLAELPERVHVLPDVVLGVLDRDRPLLLVAGRHEDAAVDHPRERGVEELRDRLQEVAVVGERLLAVRHASLGPQVDGVRRKVGLLDRAGAPLGEKRSELAELVVRVRRQDLGEGREPGGYRERIAVE